jgi:hypothetical protein
VPDYAAASRTKDHFQDQLLQEHPEIVSIAPRLKLDADGFPTREAVIVIGVKSWPPLRLAPVIGPQPQSAAVPGPRPPAALLPSQLPVIDAQGQEVRNQTVEVLIEEEGEILPQMLTARQRPCPGGYSVGHPRVTVGTLGGVTRLGRSWGYILSNNHVLAGSNSGAVGDPIYQPAVADGGSQADRVGQLARWVPLDFSGRNNEVDCALAKAFPPWTQNLRRHVRGIGTPTTVGDATVGQGVRKSGRTTQITTGTVLSDNASVRLSYGVGKVAVFVNQLQYSHMTQGGDSGSLVWDRDSLTVLGLHFAGGNSASYGNKIRRVLALLGRARTVVDARGRQLRFHKVPLSL